jgi:predicted tellurium resistance membrane protein TerC
MLELLTNPDAWIALATLTLLEIVLGIDNIVFIAILASRLPVEKQGVAYRLGLLGAMVTRIALLMTINWVMQLTEPMFEVMAHPFSGRDLILLGGGLFLIAKSTQEMYEKVEGEPEEDIQGWFSGLPGIIVQIMIPRHHLLARFGNHRGRHGGGHRGNGRRRGHRDRGDALVRETDR